MRIGIVGCGGIGRRHLLSYQNNGLAPTALADAFADAAEAAANEWGGTPYGDFRAMFERERLDAISICTPPNVHREIAVAALEAGIAVLCEKPMTTTLEDAEAIEAAADRTGSLFMIGHCHRFQPHIEKVKELIEAGDLGVPRMYRARIGFSFPRAQDSWFSNPEVAGGSIHLDTHVHTVDIFRYLIGDVVEVAAVMSSVDTPMGPALEVEDSAIMIVKSTEGALGVMEASWRTPPSEVSVTVYGTAGRAVVDYGVMELRVQMADEKQPTVVSVSNENRFDREIRHFVAAVRGEEAPRLTPREGVEAIRILMKAYYESQAQPVHA